MYQSYNHYLYLRFTLMRMVALFIVITAAAALIYVPRSEKMGSTHKPRHLERCGKICNLLRKRAENDYFHWDAASNYF